MTPGALYNGGSRGGAWGARPPLFLDQTEAQRAEIVFCETIPSPYLRVWMTDVPHSFSTMSLVLLCPLPTGL